MPAALVTGASGALGRQLVRYLVDRGWSITTLARSAVPPDGPGRGHIRGDILDADAVRRASEGADVVFHLAARLEGTGSAEDMLRVNVDGTGRVARIARESGARRLVYFGSAAVYGDTTGTIATESSPPAPTSAYARSKLQGESAALAEGPDPIVLRLGAAYGEHQLGNYFRLARWCSRGVRLTGENRRSLIEAEDALAAAALAGEHVATSHRVFNITDGTPHTLTAITAAMSAALARPRRVVRIPAGSLARFARWVPLSALTKLGEDSAVDSALARRVLDFRPAWSLEDGWRRSIEAWRARGLL